MRRIIAFTLLLTLLSACKRDEPIGRNEYAQLRYSQTQCADPWSTGSRDSLTLKNVAAYLNAASLYVAGLSIKQDVTLTQICDACFCKTGKTICVSALNSNSLIAKYERIGFRP